MIKTWIGIGLVLGFTLLAVLGCAAPAALNKAPSLSKPNATLPSDASELLLPMVPRLPKLTETPMAAAPPELTPTMAATATLDPTPTTAAREPTAEVSKTVVTLDPTPTYPPPPEAVHVPILMYHYVSDLPAEADEYRRDLTVSPERFEEHLQYLRDAGYQSITLTDIYTTLTTGKPLPERPVVLTFDDGYKDAYTNVLPLLQTYGFVGEFFVLATPAHHEAPHHLSWSDMQAMANAGMIIQAHGRDHYDLTERSYEFLVYQILGAREAIEAHTHQPVSFFCYPSGRYDEDTQAVVAAAGYVGAVTTAWGTELSLENRYGWPRVRIRGGWSTEMFAEVLASLEE